MKNKVIFHFASYVSLPFWVNHDVVSVERSGSAWVVAPSKVLRTGFSHQGFHQPGAMKKVQWQQRDLHMFLMLDFYSCTMLYSSGCITMFNWGLQKIYMDMIYL